MLLALTLWLGAQDKSEDEKIVETLRAQKMTIDLPQNSFDEFTDVIREYTGFNVVPVGVETLPDSVTAVFVDVPVGTVLDLVLDPHKLRWIVEDGIIQIKIGCGLPGPKSEIFDVRDLTAEVVDKPSREFPDEVGRVETLSAKQIVQLIEQTIDRGQWHDGRSIEASEGALTVTAPPSVLETVRRLLAELRRVKSAPHSIEGLLLSVPAKEAADIPVGPIGASAAARLMASKHVVQRVSVTALNGQRVHATTGEEHVIDVRATVVPGSSASRLEVRVAGVGFKSASTATVAWDGAFVAAVGRGEGDTQRFVLVQARARPSQLSETHLEGHVLFEPAGPMDLMDPPKRAASMPEVKKINEALETKKADIDLSNGETLEAAVGLIAERLGETIYVSPSVKEAHASPDVTLRLKGCSLRTILKILLGDRGLALTRRKGVLVVANRKELEGLAGSLLFDWRDIAPPGEVEFLTRTIKAMAGPWDEESQLAVYGHLLVATNTEKALDEVRDVVKKIGETMGRQRSITLRVTFIEVDPAKVLEAAREPKFPFTIAGALPALAGRVLDDVSMTGRTTETLKASLAAASIEARPVLAADGKSARVDLKLTHDKASSDGTDVIPVGGARVTQIGKNVVVVVRAEVSP